MDKKNREQAEALRQHVLQMFEGRPPGQAEAAMLSWGRGIKEEVTPGLGMHATDAVYVLMRGALVYQYLHTPPKELFGLKARMQGLSPKDWKSVSAEVFIVNFHELERWEARTAVDGRCDFLFVPRNLPDGEYLGFGLIEAYGGKTPVEVVAWAEEPPAPTLWTPT